jgi:hypothetical protein
MNHARAIGAAPQLPERRDQRHKERHERDATQQSLHAPRAALRLSG